MGEGGKRITNIVWGEGGVINGQPLRWRLEREEFGLLISNYFTTSPNKIAWPADQKKKKRLY